jgi:hypothetical protein
MDTPSPPSYHHDDPAEQSREQAFYYVVGSAMLWFGWLLVGEASFL